MLRAALAYRKGQAFALMVLSALVAACACFAPLYITSVDSALIQARLSELPTTATSFTVSNYYDKLQSRPRLTEAQITSVLPADLVKHHGKPVFKEQLFITLNDESMELRSVTGACSHLRIDQGRCATKPLEVTATTAEARARGWKIGQQLKIGKQTITIVGLYTQPINDPFWTGDTLAIHTSGAPVPFGKETPPGRDGDVFITPVQTISAFAPPGGQQFATWPLLPKTINIDNLDPITEAAQKVAKDPLLGDGTTARTALTTLKSQVKEDQSQVRVIAPLIMTQLAVLLLIVLQLVLGAAVDARRSEMALSRLRGLGVKQARRRVLLELAVPILIGFPLGVGLAYLADAAARRFWLPGEVAWPTTWNVIYALVAAAVVLLALLLVVVRRGTRSPISNMLSGVAERGSAKALGGLDLILVTASAVAVAMAATGNVSGPVALVIPSLLALGVGILLSYAIGPVSSWITKRSARRGKPGRLLAAVQIARRPATRRTISVLTVAVAMVTFNLNAAAIAGVNRERRAQIETGAAMVVEPNFSEASSDSLLDVQSLVRRLDPTGKTLTPVLLMSANQEGPFTAGINPDEYLAVSYDTGLRRDFSGMSAGAVPEVSFRGTAISVRVTTNGLLTQMPRGAPNVTWKPSTHAKPPSKTAPDAASYPYQNPTRITSPHLYLTFKRPGKSLERVSLGTIPDQGEPAKTLSAPVECTTGCRVISLQMRYDGTDAVIDWPKEKYGVMPTKGSITVDDARTNAGPIKEFTTNWAKPDDPSTAQSASGASALKLSWTVEGDEQFVVMHRGSVPSGGIIPTDLRVSGQSDFDGRIQISTLQEDLVAPVVTTVPFLAGLPANSQVITIRNLTRATDVMRTDGRVFIFSRDASPAMQKKLQDGLAKNQIETLHVQRYTDTKARYDASASAWGLQLAVMAAVASLLLALLVMIIVATTGWRNRSRDVAAMTLAGVPTKAIRRAALWEQLVVGFFAVVVGAGAGIAGSALVMDTVPLWATDSVLPITDLSTNWIAIATAIVLSVLGMTVVGLALVRRLMSSSSPSRLRDSA